jgi:hypothetical protein
MPDLSLNSLERSATAGPNCASQYAQRVIASNARFAWDRWGGRYSAGSSGAAHLSASTSVLFQQA